MEEQIKLTARLYQARDAAKLLYGKDYKKKVVEYQRYLNAAMKKHGLEEIPAAMKLIEDLGLKDVGALNLLAAVVEMIEPSKP